MDTNRGSGVAERSARQLEAVVAAIDAGEITATSAERAHLVGSAHALRLAADLPR